MARLDVGAEKLLQPKRALLLRAGEGTGEREWNGRDGQWPGCGGHGGGAAPAACRTWRALLLRQRGVP